MSTTVTPIRSGTCTTICNDNNGKKCGRGGEIVTESMCNGCPFSTTVKKQDDVKKITRSH